MAKPLLTITLVLITWVDVAALRLQAPGSEDGDVESDAGLIVEGDLVENFWELQTNLSSSVSEFGSKFIDGVEGGDWRCSRSRFLKPSPEDLHMGHTTCPEQHVYRTREYPNIQGKDGCAVNDFGMLLSVKNERFMWIENLKCGSRTFYELFENISSTRELQRFRTDRDVEGIKSFAMVRHPIARFISAYGTVMNRIGGERFGGNTFSCMQTDLRNVLPLPEPARFNAFVDLYIKYGADLMRLSNCRRKVEHHRVDECALVHVMSQTWFMNLWPGKIHLLMHAETFAADVHQLSNMIGLQLLAPGHHNEQEGSSDEIRMTLLKQHETIQKLHDYLRSEMARFGYAPLAGWE